MTNATEVTELVEAAEPEVKSSLATEAKLVVVEKPDGISDMLVETEEAVTITDLALSPPAVQGASTGIMPFDLANRFGDAVETELSLLGAETVSKVVVMGLVIVVELEVPERLRVLD